MKIKKRTTIFLAIGITAVCSILVVPLLLDSYQDLPIQPDYSSSITKAIDFFEGSRDPYALLWLDVIYRRFGIVEFTDALQRFDEVLAERPLIVNTMSVFRRIAVYNNYPTATDFYEAYKQGESNLFTIPALYSDRLELPDDYPTMLNEAVKRGDYQLTHALLAWIWIQENGCEVALPDGFIEDMYRSNAALINSDSSVTDLELEAAAFLYIAGQGNLVNDTFLEHVIADQNENGGWDPPNAYEWHSTVLGLLLLLHVEYPADSYPPTLAQPSF
jgi:hypothetical protein